MEDTPTTFLGRLQGSDHANKKRWLIILSTLVTIGVVYIWLAYFLALTAAPTESAETKPSNSFSVLETISRGTAYLYESALNTINNWRVFLGSSKEIIINPGSSAPANQ